MSDRPLFPDYVWKGERRAGYRWRLLAHKDGGSRQIVCGRCGFKGPYPKHPKKCDGDWDEQRHVATVEMHSTDFAEPVCFDEVVVDDWFHLEQMDDRYWWMRVGDLHINVHVRADGRRDVSTHWDTEDGEPPE